MAMTLRRRRRRIHIEGWADGPRPFCVTRLSDPFGDIDRPPYDAVRNLTENGELPELFAELPNAHSDEIVWIPGSSRASFLATEVTAPASSRIAAEPMH
jgi:hypothetical protein